MRTKLLNPKQTKAMASETKHHFTGKEGGPIDLHEAAGWTKNYREKHPGETISHLFGKEILHSILGQDGCVGIRFYHAYDHSGNKHIIIVGVTSDGKELLVEEIDVETSGGANHQLFGAGDQSTPCPGSPGCPTGLLSGGK